MNIEEAKTIKERLKIIRDRIEEAKIRSGREKEDIKLLAVTKTVTPERIVEAVEAGQSLFGENYVQEAKEKIDQLKESGFNLEWHFIGHLQRNKVKYIIGYFSCIETLDSIKLAKEINKHAQKHGICLPCFIQINISGEETKFGIAPKELERFLDELSDFKNITITGLMTLPPFSLDPEQVRPYFIQLRELRDKFYKTHPVANKMIELSMGMTNDFEIAIEEGATIVRIGTAIFGPRPCKFEPKQ